MVIRGHKGEAVAPLLETMGVFTLVLDIGVVMAVLAVVTVIAVTLTFRMVRLVFRAMGPVVVTVATVVHGYYPP